MNITVPIPAQDLDRVLESVNFNGIDKTVQVTIQNHLLGQSLESSVVSDQISAVFQGEPQAVIDGFTRIIEKIFAAAAQRSINDVVGGFLE